MLKRRRETEPETGARGGGRKKRLSRLERVTGFFCRQVAGVMALQHRATNGAPVSAFPEL